MTYAEYMKSPLWQFARKLALNRAGHRCEVCRNSRCLQVHHKAYPKRLGKEKLSDLVVLCKWCHARAHGLPPPDPYNLKPFSQTVQEALVAIEAGKQDEEMTPF